MINFLNNIKIVFISILINFFLISAVLADKLKEIKIFGNERLSKETIILFQINLTMISMLIL